MKLNILNHCKYFGVCEVGYHDNNHDVIHIIEGKKNL